MAGGAIGQWLGGLNDCLSLLMCGKLFCGFIGENVCVS